MIDITFYIFSKRSNSTAKPHDDTGKTLHCNIVDPCSLTSPSISLSLGDAKPVDYTFCYIPAFGRYYHIVDWTVDKNLWVADLRVDVLATYRDQIGDQHLYVLRSSKQWDYTIVDGKYPITSSLHTRSVSTSSPWSTSPNDGSFVIGTVGDGLAQYYSLLGPSLDRFLRVVFSDEYATLLMGPEWITLYPQLKAMVNPAQYITSITFFPLSVTGSQVETIPVGWVDVPASPAQGVAAFSLPINHRIKITRSFDALQLRHFQADQRGSYLNNAPYSAYELFFPPFGTIPLPAHVVARATAITAEVLVDSITGQGTLRLTDNKGVTFVQLSAPIGVSVVLGDTAAGGIGLLGGASAGLGILGNLVTGNIAGAIGAGAGALQNFVGANIPATSTVGSIGGLAQLAGTPKLSARQALVVDDDPDHYGRPLCQVRRLGALPGYLLISDADINIECTDGERQAIKTFLEGGFFFE